MKWPHVRIGDVCDLNPRLPKTHTLNDDDAVSFVPMAAVSELSGTIQTRSTRRFAEVRKGYTPFQNNDVLFAKITPCMENGKAAIARDLVHGYGFGSTEFHVLRAGENVLPEWLHFFVRQATFRHEAKRNFTGTGGQQRVPATFVANTLIPLPPLPEQRRIVDLLTRAEGIVRLRREAAAKAAELIPAIFIDMFGDPECNPHQWPVESLSALVQEFRYGTSQKSGPVGLPVLRIPNVVGGEVNLSEMKLVDLPEKERERLTLRDGDLLFVRTNGNPDYVGRSAVYQRADLDASGLDGGNCVYASYLIRARIGKASVTAHYIQAYLSTSYGRKLLRERAKTSAGQYNINIDGLGSLPVLVPSMHLQDQFNARSDGVKAIMSQQQAALEKAQATFNALLAQAFAPRGGL